MLPYFAIATSEECILPPCQFIWPRAIKLPCYFYRESTLTNLLLCKWAGGLRCHVIVEQKCHPIIKMATVPTFFRNQNIFSCPKLFFCFHKHHLLELLAFVAQQRLFRTRSWIGDREIVSWFKTGHWLLARKWKVKFRLLQILLGGSSVWSSKSAVDSFAGASSNNLRI
jgi:hypothetical protein